MSENQGKDPVSLLQEDMRTKLPSKAFYVVLGILTVSLSGSYAYTHSVEAKTYENEKKIEQIVTKDDIKELKDAMVEAIKELK